MAQCEVGSTAMVLGMEPYPNSWEARCELAMAEHAGRSAAMDGVGPRSAGQHGNAHRAERRRYMAAYNRMCAALYN